MRTHHSGKSGRQRGARPPLPRPRRWPPRSGRSPSRRRKASSGRRSVTGGFGSVRSRTRCAPSSSAGSIGATRSRSSSRTKASFACEPLMRSPGGSSATPSLEPPQAALLSPSPENRAAGRCRRRRARAPERGTSRCVSGERKAQRAPAPSRSAPNQRFGGLVRARIRARAPSQSGSNGLPGSSRSMTSGA